jgi:hypothetical protein
MNKIQKLVCLGPYKISHIYNYNSYITVVFLMQKYFFFKLAGNVIPFTFNKLLGARSLMKKDNQLMLYGPKNRIYRIGLM